LSKNPSRFLCDLSALVALLFHSVTTFAPAEPFVKFVIHIHLNSMKHIYTIVILFWATVLQSQPVITSANFFQMSTAYPFRMIDNITDSLAIASGYNITWDFSIATSSDSDAVLAIDPSTTIFYNDTNVNYNLSNICLYVAGQPNAYDEHLYSYWITDSTAANFIGEWANNGIWEVWYYHLWNPEKYFAFPFTINNTFTDTLTGSLVDVSGFGLVPLQGTRTVLADAFGTLIMPDAVYDSCLRIKTERLVNGYSNIYYTWFQPQRSGIILQADGYNNSIYNFRYYYQNPLVTGIPTATESPSFQIFPNPVNESMNVLLHNFNDSKTQSTIADLTGRTIFSNNFTTIGTQQNISVNMEKFASGVYTVTIQTGGYRTVKKIVKQ
jgi:hypothetical protein